MASTISVLLADDAVTERTLLRHGLERDGRFKVVAEAGSAPEAIELCASLLPDAVVLDVSPAACDGAQAISRIHHRSPDSKIIALAGSADGLTRLTDAAGADALLDKATAAGELTSTLQSLL